jgi:hypothetical protein
MSTEQLDYTAILADLEAKKTALEQTIASFRAAMAAGALGQVGDAGSGIMASLGASVFGGEVPTGAFLRKSIPEAARLYLEIVKKKQTSREIAEGLRKGGMESTSKNFFGMVHAVLDRARKAPNSPFVKIGSQWALAGWFPKGIVAAGSQGRATKKKVRRDAKSARAKVAPRAEAALPSPAQAELVAAPREKANERALAFILTKPQGEHSLIEVAQHLGMGVKGARLILGKLVKNGKIRMSAPSTYTAAPLRLTAAS